MKKLKNLQKQVTKNKHRIQEEAEELFRAKQRRRQELAKLPFESKIFILCRLQKLAEDIRAQ
ncbi:MAG: hypothetical protein PHT49_07405 [Desulfovibrionales bacterium]|nr:hypothetical protein [Desulfovibrionales bacterium]